MELSTDYLVQEYAALAETVAAMENDMAAIKAELADRLPVGKEQTYGDVRVTVKSVQTVDPKRVELSTGQMQRVTTRKLDMAKLKSVYPAAYTAALRDPKITVSINLPK